MNYTYQEITNQPLSWEQTLIQAECDWSFWGSDLRIEEETPFLFIGCGSSYYLSLTAATLFQELTGHVSKAIPASEVFLAGDSVLPPSGKAVAFAISRSGTTSEVLKAVEYLQENYPDIQTLGVTCYAGQTLASLTAPFTIALEHAAEKSVVMTQAFTNILLALQVFAAHIAKRLDKIDELRKLPAVLKNQIVAFDAAGQQLGSDHTRNFYVFLGLGKYYGLAREATLKLKEMTQMMCDAYNPLEFRHGPISTITKDSCVVLMQGKQGDHYIADVAVDVANYGALVTLLHPNDVWLPEHSCQDIALQGDLSDWARTVLYMPVLHFIAYYKAISLGLNPDHPRNLNQVVVLKNL